MLLAGFVSGLYSEEEELGGWLWPPDACRVPPEPPAAAVPPPPVPCMSGVESLGGVGGKEKRLEEAEEEATAEDPAREPPCGTPARLWGTPPGLWWCRGDCLAVAKGEIQPECAAAAIMWWGAGGLVSPAPGAAAIHGCSGECQECGRHT